MKNNRREPDRDHLHDNVSKLIDRAGPHLSMPRERKDAVLSALTEEARRRRSPLQLLRGKTRKMISTKLVPWIAGSAAGVAFLIVSLVSNGASRAVAWIDVARTLERFETMTMVMVTEEPNQEALNVQRMWLGNRTFRTDLYRSAPKTPTERAKWLKTAPIAQTMLCLSEPRKRTLRQWDFASKTVQRHTTLFDAESAEGRAEVPAGEFHALIRKLRLIPTDNARRIGERMIDDKRAAGFEISYEKLFGLQATGVEGFVRVFVDEATDVPLRIETEQRSQAGVRRVWSDELRWNEPIAADVFVAPETKDWRVQETTMTASSLGTAFKSGVDFIIRAPEGDGSAEAVSTKDVATVLEWYDVDSDGRTPTKAMLIISLTEVGRRRFSAIAAKSPTPTVLLDGKRLSGGPPFIDPARSGVVIDVTSLDLTATEFAEKYLR